ncbi:transglycosylase family protein [Streptomyces sp. NPDC006289]|uniref:transglycosylase family protein n=1 Tax=Streptomyces sp. NPDC006289 TaxID=3156744 RepID=UPI00339FC008
MIHVRRSRSAVRSSAAASVLALSLAFATPASGASVATWDKVARCESGGDWSINTGTDYSGGLQISNYNWQHYGGTAYAAHAYQATKRQQILVAEKILADQGAGAWTCSPGTGLSTDTADPYPLPRMSNLTNAGDLTYDGVPDMIAVKRSTGVLYRYSGPDFSGDTRVQIGTGWGSMTSITAVGDQNGDGTTDIVVTASDGKLYRYTGPDFSGANRVEIGTGWTSMADATGVGDLTGDGVPDMIAVKRSTGVLYRYSGPDFSGDTRVQIGTGWGSMTSITAVGDQNGDGTTDVLAADARGKLYRYSGPGYAGGNRVQVGTGWDVMAELTGPGDVTGSAVPDLLAVDIVSGVLYRYSGPGFSGASRTGIGTGW